MNIDSRIKKLEDTLAPGKDNVIVLTPADYKRRMAEGWTPPNGVTVMVPDNIKKPDNAGTGD